MRRERERDREIESERVWAGDNNIGGGGEEAILKLTKIWR